MSIIQCPNCKLKVITTNDDKCPNCKKPIILQDSVLTGNEDNVIKNISIASKSYKIASEVINSKPISDRNDNKNNKKHIVLYWVISIIWFFMVFYIPLFLFELNDNIKWLSLTTGVLPIIVTFFITYSSKQFASSCFNAAWTCLSLACMTYCFHRNKSNLWLFLLFAFVILIFVGLITNAISNTKRATTIPIAPSIKDDLHNILK